MGSICPIRATPIFYSSNGPTRPEQNCQNLNHGLTTFSDKGRIRFLKFLECFIEGIDEPGEKVSGVAALCELKSSLRMQNHRLEEFVGTHVRAVVVIFPNFAQQLTYKLHFIFLDIIWYKISYGFLDY